MSVCIRPEAPIVECKICRRDVHTCQRIKADIASDYHTCPVHPNSIQLEPKGKDWVCSYECLELATD